MTRILPSSQDALHEQNGDQFDHLHSGSFGLHSSLHLSSWSHSGMLQSHGGGAHSSLQRSDWSHSGTLQSHGGGAHGEQSLNDDLLLGPTITRLNPVNFQKFNFPPFCSKTNSLNGSEFSLCELRKFDFCLGVNVLWFTWSNFFWGFIRTVWIAAWIAWSFSRSGSVVTTCCRAWWPWFPW